MILLFCIYHSLIGTDMTYIILASMCGKDLIYLYILNIVCFVLCSNKCNMLLCVLTCLVYPRLTLYIPC